MTKHGRGAGRTARGGRGNPFLPGQTYFDLGRLSRRSEQYEQARDLLIEAHGEAHADVARQYGNLGLTHESLQDFEAAEAAHRRALALRRELFGETHDDVAKNLVTWPTSWSTCPLRGGRAPAAGSPGDPARDLGRERERRHQPEQPGQPHAAPGALRRGRPLLRRGPGHAHRGPGRRTIPS